MKHPYFGPLGGLSIRLFLPGSSKTSASALAAISWYRWN